MSKGEIANGGDAQQFEPCGHSGTDTPDLGHGHRGEEIIDVLGADDGQAIGFV